MCAMVAYGMCDGSFLCHGGKHIQLNLKGQGGGGGRREVEV